MNTAQGSLLVLISERRFTGRHHLPPRPPKVYLQPYLVELKVYYLRFIYMYVYK